MIGAMHLGVTIHAALSEQELRRIVYRKTGGIVHNRRVPGLRMTGLA